MTYARVVHSIFLDTRYTPRTKRFAFEFTHNVYSRLANPDLFNRNYPPHMMFTSGAKTIREEYMEKLKNLESGSAYGHTKVRKNKDKQFNPGNFMERRNPENPIAPSRNDVVGSAYNQRERSQSATLIGVEPLDKTFSKALSKVSGRLSKDTQDRHVILVTTEEDRDVCERIVASVGNPEFITAMVVFGEESYIEKRYDLYGVTEVGISSYADLMRLHRNNVDRKRVAALKALETYAESNPDTDGPGTMRGLALEELRKVANGHIEWERKYCL